MVGDALGAVGDRLGIKVGDTLGYITVCAYKYAPLKISVLTAL